MTEHISESMLSDPNAPDFVVEKIDESSAPTNATRNASAFESSDVTMSS